MMKTKALTAMCERRANLKRLYSQATIEGECVIAPRLFFSNDRVVNSARFAYESIEGPMPHGTGLRHTCGRKACINVYHLARKA